MRFIQAFCKRLGPMELAVILLMTMAVGPHSAFADGMAFDRTSFEPLKPHEQRATIRHKNGMQDMLIALDLRSDHAVWLFPVPGKPDQVSVDVAGVFPMLSGFDLRRRGRSAQIRIFLAPLLTQVPLAPILVPYYLSYKRGLPEGVTTHMSVDRFGIHGEVITATSVEALKDYLRQHGLPVTGERLVSFKDYLSDKFTIVAGWISAREGLERTVRSPGPDSGSSRPGGPCLFVRFPTQNVYYPLKATAGYGDLMIPINVQILGLKTVEYPPLTRSKALHPLKQEDDSYGVYYLRGWAQVDRELNSRPAEDTTARSFNGPLRAFIEELKKQPVDYTLVRIMARAGAFTQDLQGSDQMPEDVEQALAALRASENIWLLAAWTLLLSVVTGALAGLIMFRRPLAYAVLGSFNLLTLLGLAVAVGIYRSRRGEPRRTLKFTVVYTVVFYVLTLLTAMLWVPAVLAW